MDECRTVQALLALKPEEWSAEQRRLIEAHLADCARCAAMAPTPARREGIRTRYPRAERADRAFEQLRTGVGTAVAAAMAIALLVLGLILLLGGKQPAPQTPDTSPTLYPQQTVAALLASPPAPGEPVEVDAYYSGAIPAYLPGPPRVMDGRVYCPTYSPWMVALTDQPFTPLLRVLNSTSSNPLPAGLSWLAAAAPESTRPDNWTAPNLPYHARLRGRLGDPAFSHCPDAARIFLVEKVVAVYQQVPPGAGESVTPLQPPSDYVNWPRHDDPALCYSLPYPPDWTPFPLLDEGSAAAIALRSPDRPASPVELRVYRGETWYDPYLPAAIPPLLQGDAFGLFTQGWVWGSQVAVQGLSGYIVERPCPQGGECRWIRTLFNGCGHTYELSLAYHTGLSASQPLLTAYTAIVEGLRLDPPPGPTPTPPVNQELGPGPFISREAALAALGEGQNVELLEAELLSEAEARRRSDVCSSFEGHPAGVWLLRVRGDFEGSRRTMLFFIDAASGDQMCGEER